MTHVIYERPAVKYIRTYRAQIVCGTYRIVLEMSLEADELRLPIVALTQW